MNVLEICNHALSRIGQRPIDGLTNSHDPIAQQCRFLYSIARRETLVACRWTFATRVEKIYAIPYTESEDCEPGEYKTMFQLPTLCLRVLKVDSDSWTLMGRSLWVAETNRSSLMLTYLRDVENPDFFDPLFIEALSCRLAEKLALPVAGSHTLRQSLQNEYYKVILPQATYLNQVQCESNDQHPLQQILKMSLFS